MRKQFFIFTLILLLLITYTCYKLVFAFNLSKPESLAVTLPLFFLMFGNFFVSRINPLMDEKKWYQYLTILGSLLMGFWGTFIIFSIITDFIKIIILIGINFLPSQSVVYIEISDWLFKFSNQYSFIIPIVAIIITVLGFLETIRGPVIKKIALKHKNINSDLHNFRIVQISDLHIGPSIQNEYINKVIQRTQQLDPDIIVLTGDIIDANPKIFAEQIQLLSHLKAKHGVYYIAGNHEYYWEINTVLNSLKKTNLTILMNQNNIIKLNNTNLMIAGITDPTSKKMDPLNSPDLNKTLLNAQNSIIDFKILLAHQPNIYSEASQIGVDLLLSGHTHGGQFFPFNLLVPLVHKYYRGLAKHHEMAIYVNPGTGYWGPMNRFGIPAEISLLVLTQD